MTHSFAQKLEKAVSSSNVSALTSLLSNIENDFAVWDAWHRALDEKKYDLIDAFMSNVGGVTENVWCKMLQAPPTYIQTWLGRFDQWPNEEEKSEGWVFLHRALMSNPAPHVLPLVMRSGTFQSRFERALPLAWVWLAVQSRHPSEKTWTEKEKEAEKELREAIWESMTPKQWFQTVLSIVNDDVFRRSNLMLPELRLNPPVSFQQSFGLWAPEFRSWPTENIDEFLDLHRSWLSNPRDSMLLPKILSTKNWSLEDCFPEMLDCVSGLEKELLRRATHPNQTSESFTPKRKM